MAERKLRRRKAKPLEEAMQFSLLGKDRNGLECKFINDIKGRGVFSCTEFEKGNFLLEYRGELISKEQCEQRQRIYHDALKVFMFEFRYNGKRLCVDAARDDGSLGRFVNDDHINPNSKMKTICVDGKPHLCLFALRRISPGEEITYDYGDAECPWRNTNDQCLKNLKKLEKDTAAVKTLSVVELSTLEINTVSQSEVTEVEKLMDVSNPSIVMDSGICEASEGVEKVTPVKDQSSLNDPDCDEKMLLVEEHVLTDKENFGATERALEVCKHVVVSSTFSSMDKCVECVGPVGALKWVGLRCKRSDVSDPEESESDDEEAAAGAAGDSSNAGVREMAFESTTEVPEENEIEAEKENQRKGQKVSWSKAEIAAVMTHFKAHIIKGKLATMTECQQCKTAEDALARRSAQNI